MDAEAYLKKQGWRGTGHSLDHTDRGIKKALQISKKVDALGVGIQKYGAVSDQWWMRAYDQGLKNLGTGKESELDKVRKHGHDRGGLYARFVKGQPIPGTIDDYIASIQAGDDKARMGKGQRTSTRSCTVARPKENGFPNDAEGMQVRSRKGMADRADTVTSSASEHTADLRTLVEVFVNEAIRRGVIPANDGKPRRSSERSPSDADMAKVLAIAGLPDRKRILKRQHMVRALKRAAMQHIEATRPS